MIAFDSIRRSRALSQLGFKEEVNLEKGWAMRGEKTAPAWRGLVYRCSGLGWDTKRAGRNGTRKVGRVEPETI